MAKRFTDTDKWKRPWFRQLPIKAKLAWTFLCDQCDHAGIWIADFELLSFQMDIKVTEADFQEWFGPKLVKFEDDKFFIPSFYDFQYADAKEGFKAKQSALKTLTKLGLVDSTGTVAHESPNSYPTVTQQSMDCPSIGIGIGIGIGKEESVRETKTSPEPCPFQEIYKIFPRKVGGTEGIKRLKDRRWSPEIVELFKTAVVFYASECRRLRTDEKYIKHFSSFIGVDGKEPWRDYIPVKRTPSHAQPSQEAIRYDYGTPPHDEGSKSEALDGAAVRELLNKMGTSFLKGRGA